jgi:hypothetical protein
LIEPNHEKVFKHVHAICVEVDLEKGYLRLFS